MPLFVEPSRVMVYRCDSQCRWRKCRCDTTPVIQPQPLKMSLVVYSTLLKNKEALDGMCTLYVMIATTPPRFTVGRRGIIRLLFTSRVILFSSLWIDTLRPIPLNRTNSVAAAKYKRRHWRWSTTSSVRPDYSVSRHDYSTMINPYPALDLHLF
jgi:hypothetical protein